MEEKLHIPRFRFLTQNCDGAVRCHITYPSKDLMAQEHVSDRMIKISDGARNPDWENTLIDRNVDGYTFEDGILKRVPA